MKVFLKETISDLESNIHYKNDLKYINRLNIELDKLKKEVNEDTRIDIKCPYCRNKIWINNDVNVNEVTCPKCFNLIEIGWK